MKLLRGAVAALGLFALLGLLIGFWDFTHAARGHAQALPADAEGLVSLTGGSVQRLTTGMRLLSEGHGRRLLITGVNPQVTDKEMQALLGAEDVKFACCVDIGRAAEDTLGNASETAAWAKKHGYTKLIVVTDDYHMPRALLELRLAMPKVELTPYPVSTPVTAAGAWRKNPDTAAKLLAEYGKYIVILARETLRGGAPSEAAGKA